MACVEGSIKSIDAADLEAKLEQRALNYAVTLNAALFHGLHDGTAWTEAQYAKTLVDLYPWRAEVATCDRCHADIGVGLSPMSNAAEHAVSARLIDLEVEHALNGCNGSLSWNNIKEKP